MAPRTKKEVASATDEALQAKTLTDDASVLAAVAGQLDMESGTGADSSEGPRPEGLSGEYLPANKALSSDGSAGDTDEGSATVDDTLTKDGEGLAGGGTDGMDGHEDLGGETPPQGAIEADQPEAGEGDATSQGDGSANSGTEDPTGDAPGDGEPGSPGDTGPPDAIDPPPDLTETDPEDSVSEPVPLSAWELPAIWMFPATVRLENNTSSQVSVRPADIHIPAYDSATVEITAEQYYRLGKDLYQHAELDGWDNLRGLQVKYDNSED